MKKHTDLDVNILMHDGFTRSEAIRELRSGTEIWTDLKELARAYDLKAFNIETGKVSDICPTEYEGKKYYIVIVH